MKTIITLMSLCIIATSAKASSEGMESISIESAQLEATKSIEHLESVIQKRPELVSEELNNALVYANYSIDRVALVQSANEKA